MLTKYTNIGEVHQIPADNKCVSKNSRALVYKKENEFEEGDTDKKLLSVDEKNALKNPEQKPTIFLSEKDTDELVWDVEETWKGLESEKEDPTLFHQGTNLYRIERGFDNITLCTETGIQRRLQNRIHFVGPTDRWGNTKKAENLPSTLKSELLESMYPILPEVEMSYKHPIITPSLKFVGQKGYNEETSTYILETTKTDWDSIDPTPEKVNESVEYLTENLIADFRFKDDTSIANYFAYLFTFPIRTMIKRGVPIFAVSAPQQAVGKSTLLEFASNLWLGHLYKSIPCSEDQNSNEEIRKKFSSYIPQMYENLVFDNIVKPMRESVIASTITNTYYTDRKLGSNEIIDVKFRSITAATGNNLILKGDILRRSYWCELISKEGELPENRDDFKHLDTDKYVLSNRDLLQYHIFTIIKGWIEAGANKGSGKKKSFYEWAGIISGILEFAGIEGFQPRDVMKKDPIVEDMEKFCSVVYKYKGSEPYYTKDVYEYACRLEDGEESKLSEPLKDDEEDALESQLSRIRSRQGKLSKLGTLHKEFTNRQLENYRIVEVNSKGTRSQYQIVKTGEEPHQPELLEKASNPQQQVETVTKSKSSSKLETLKEEIDTLIPTYGTDPFTYKNLEFRNKSTADEIAAILKGHFLTGMTINGHNVTYTEDKDEFKFSNGSNTPEPSVETELKESKESKREGMDQYIIELINESNKTSFTEAAISERYGNEQGKKIVRHLATKIMPRGVIVDGCKIVLEDGIYVVKEQQ